MSHNDMEEQLRDYRGLEGKTTLPSLLRLGEATLRDHRHLARRRRRVYPDDGRAQPLLGVR
jgi:hypothetical protein